MVEWQIEPFDSSHDRSKFSCGEASLDHFLHSQVSQYEKRHLGRTYVLVASGAKQVLGYYTLASSAILYGDLPLKLAKKLPKHQVPVILLGRLAVDLSLRGQGIGRILLKNALERCILFSSQVGIYAVIVDALNENAKNFYQQFGFAQLENNEMRLFILLATLEKGLP